MRISWNWLRSLIDTDLTPREAAEILTSTGLEVESVEAIEPVKGMLAGVVVGRVMKREKHPDADRLSVCRVDVGNGEELGIVCGAPNVAEGQKVLVATVGTTLHPRSGDPLVIKRSKIRGVESQGMICAEDELGLGEGHAGILVLDPSADVGTPAAAQLGLHSDHALEIGLTPNRADAMSHAGVARDLAAALSVRRGVDLKVKWPDVSGIKQDDEARSTPVEVRATEACPRYSGLTLTNLHVAPSPAWLQERLTSIGLKPVNNVVDVTNYVQHELGQPLHAFDADKLTGGRIVVRMAAEGEAFTTLDGRERTLSAHDLVIADAEKPACLAGVFGGTISGVTEATSSIFLESACFDATTLRRTARRHQLNTDASFRFERGVDPEITAYALKRAAGLLKEVAGAHISSGVTDLLAAPAPWAKVSLRYAAVNALIGAAIDPAEVERTLRALDVRVISRDGSGLVVEVPPYRVDVTREADLIEEIVRIIGFDRVPLPERLMTPAMVRSEVSLEGVQRNTALHLSARGFREGMNPSLVNGELVVRLGAAAREDLVTLRNPLSAELDVLRPTMLFGLLESAAYNSARQQRDLRLFESGRTYRMADGAVKETYCTALLLTGRRWREGWRVSERMTEMADLKEELELLLQRFGIAGAGFSPVEHALCTSIVQVERNGAVLARSGLVRREVARAFDVDQPVFFAELFDEVWSGMLHARTTTFQEVPRFPAVRRDLSLLLDRSVTFAEMEKLARQSERKLLRAVDLFDVYEGEKLPEGKKSYALSFIFQDPEKTLTDEQVEKAMGRIRSALEQGTGATVRG